jgi:serine phosphatase RsbU (regulator of sigma subunit)
MPTPTPATVLLSVSPGAAADDLRAALAEAGFAVLTHALGSAPGVDFGPVAVAVVDVGDRSDAAAAQTRRWRAELGDDVVPIVWVLSAPDAAVAVRGLECGADAVLARPLDGPAFVAQVRSGVRTRAAALRVAARAAEAKLLGEQLSRAMTQADRDLDTAKRIRLASLPRAFPEVGAARFAVSHLSRGRVGSDFYGVQAVDAHRVAFFVGDTIGSAAGGLLRVFVSQVAAAHAATSPADVLAAVNRALRALDLPDPPLVAMLAGGLDTRTGELAVARAGLPAPVFVPADGEVAAWAVPGPFLGVAETTYSVRTGVLQRGGKLLVGTDGIRPDGTPGPDADAPLLATASRHRELTGQRFVDAVARDLLATVRHDDDFTLLGIELPP